MFQLSKIGSFTSFLLSWSPSLVGPFLGNGSQAYLREGRAARPLLKIPYLTATLHEHAAGSPPGGYPPGAPTDPDVRD